jgi:hypothetical protein
VNPLAALPPLAAAQAAGVDTSGSGWGQGISIWQSAGAVLIVFALLVMVLRFLGRWQQRSGQDQTSLLRVVPLGHRRELHVLRLKDHVHYVYRQEGALLHLEREPYETYLAGNPASSPVAGTAAARRPWRRGADQLARRLASLWSRGSAGQPGQESL